MDKIFNKWRLDNEMEIFLRTGWKYLKFGKRIIDTNV